MRRGPHPDQPLLDVQRDTSARAERTAEPTSATPGPRPAGHFRACGETSTSVTLTMPHDGTLRVCGANPGTPSLVPPKIGAPPRVRGGHGVHHVEPPDDRGTSACAKRAAAITPASVGLAQQAGSPPRVRSGHDGLPPLAARDWNTSADAERTSPDASPALPPSDHPRAGEADDAQMRSHEVPSGSPPRMRGGSEQDRAAHADHGVTPACAGQTL